MLDIFKKKPREERIDQEVIKRTESTFAELTSSIEFEFTELEIVLIANNLRRKLSDHLKNKRDSNIELSVNHKQKASEINSALELIE